MSNTALPEWKIFIEKQGTRTIAASIGVSNELVRLWLKKGHIPYGENLKKFISTARERLSSADFERFLNSLSKDVLGIEVMRSHAVNE